MTNIQGLGGGGTLLTLCPPPSLPPFATAATVARVQPSMPSSSSSSIFLDQGGDNSPEQHKVSKKALLLLTLVADIPPCTQSRAPPPQIPPHNMALLPAPGRRTRGPGPQSCTPPPLAARGSASVAEFKCVVCVCVCVRGGGGRRSWGGHKRATLELGPNGGEGRTTELLSGVALENVAR